MAHAIIKEMIFLFGDLLQLMHAMGALRSINSRQHAS